MVNGKSHTTDNQQLAARQGNCPVGEAVITTAGRLPAKFVIHTVGPVWQEGKEERLSALLANCYKNSLRLALENGVKTIAFPNISTGIYRYPKDKAAAVALAGVRGFLAENVGIEEVAFVCFDEENYRIYQNLLP